MADRTFLRWPFFDDEHRQFADDLDAWASREVREEEGEDVDETCRSLVRRLGADGLLRYCIPGDAGGGRAGLDVRSLCLARETLARHSGLADFALAMQGLGSGPISLFGTDEQKQRYLPPVARGERIAAFAISEPDAGSDVGAMETTARQDGGDYVLDGYKTWISNAGLADQYVVFARTGGEGTKGLSAFVVEAGTPGFSIGDRISVSAPHPLGSLKLENCCVPATQMLGKPGEGFKIAMATLDVFRTTVGAAALGFARRALDEALRRVSSRVVFGRTLAEYQLTQQRIANMAVEIDASALLIYRAAWTRDCLGGRITREASMAKLYATESAQRVVDAAVQLWGGLGVVSGVPVERLYREVRALRIYEGTSEIQQLVIGAQVLASP